MPDLISRREALALQRKRFYTGTLCKYNHDSERYVVNGACVACVNPKLDPATLPPPLEKFRLPNGRIVEVISQEEAHRRSWKTFFTGQPCNEGHMSERNVKSGRCLECMHPPKYGPDAFTGWWPFQPKPPLRVPPQTPLGVWEQLARKIQEAIPRFLQELEAEGIASLPVEPEDCLAHGILHRHRPGTDLWNGHKIWWPFPLNDRTLPGVDVDLLEYKAPWVERDGQWYAVRPSTGDLVLITPRTHEYYDPEAGPKIAALAIEAIEASEDDRARILDEQRRIMKP